jgi:hypothetical protein
MAEEPTPIRSESRRMDAASRIVGFIQGPADFLKIAKSGKILRAIAARFVPCSVPHDRDARYDPPRSPDSAQYKQVPPLHLLPPAVARYMVTIVAMVQEVSVDIT